ncbi:MAG TPA: hypothetical protein VE951_07765 [Candidatus Angelobacter sp.]|jgi:hypothetical protein|nr:hypothetical protein [Candidatus Angelobacter sp.]
MERPIDQCPYPKPFQADFDDCPAFQARQFIPLDTMYQPLDPVLTCRHLETRAMAQRHRWYAACALGDAEARRRWVREVGGVRLDRIRELQRQLGSVIAPYSEQLWSLKGQQLRAYRDARDSASVTKALRDLADQVAADSDKFLSEHADAFADVDMPADAARQLIHVAIDRFVDTQFASEVSFEVPDDVLKRFPEPVQTFFRPAVPQGQPAG